MIRYREYFPDDSDDLQFEDTYTIGRINRHVRNIFENSPTTERIEVIRDGTVGRVRIVWEKIEEEEPTTEPNVEHDL